jgi:tRNA pseudouridine55 synthase
MDNGVILIDKPSGMTSFGVVARIRRQLSNRYSKKIKVGHTGTLDPFATGLMILVIGSECKKADLYSKLDKSYEATIRLGQVSTTGDPEGQLTDFSNIVPTISDINSTVKQFIGEISQTPPIFSAIKIDGQRAYKMARAGKEITMPIRQIKIYSLDILGYEYPELKIRANVSSGTYIRTLAEDIGKALGTGAYCSELRRISIGSWSITDAKNLQ